ncbi:MAG: hypothetical protein IKB88_11815 [Clostridia bacterium]|nr:hypothetical protein [Clostridia bacterium]
MKKLNKVLLLITILVVVFSTVFTIKTDGRYIIRAGLYVAGELGLFATDYFVKDFKENQSDFEQIANLITDYGNSYDSADESESRFIYFTPERYSSSGNIIFKVKKDSSSSSSEIYFSEEETEVFKRITKCFKVEEAGFHSFSFDKKEKMVYFHTSDGRYSLVYSAENKKPYYVNGTYEQEYEQEYVTDKICKNWFNIALK